MEQETPKTVTRVRITNRNDFVIKDKFNGVAYVFAPSKPVECIPEVAAHIFGFRPEFLSLGEEEAERAMTTYCAKRHGWNRAADESDVEGTELKLARERLAKIDIQPIRLVLVEAPEEEATETVSERKKA